MKRPLGFVALLYAAGLLLAEWLQPPLPFLFETAIAVAVAAVMLRKLRWLLLCPLILLTGWTNLVYRTALLSPRDLRVLLATPPELITLRGTLTATPDERVYLHDDKESFRTLARLDVSALQRGSTWQPAFGKVAVVTTGRLPEDFFAGQEVDVYGVVALPPLPLAEGLFDYRAYLRRQGIYFQIEAAGPADWQLRSARRARPLSDRFLAWSKTTLAVSLPEEDQPLRLIRAMTLGSKSELAADVYEPFIRSGTMHIFAISGLHIALIAGILVKLLRAFQLSRAWCGWIVIPLLWFYTGATGWQPSAVRSTVMMSVVIAGWSLKRPGDLLNSLAAAALIILLWDPQQLFQAGFQLSFFVVLSIALFLPPLENLRDRLLRPDPLLPAELVPRWQRWLGGPVRYVLTGLATSLAAWLGSWPLTAYYFHLFSPVTLLANLLVVPLSSAALACNLGSLICGAWFPWATGLFNHSGWFWMWLIVRISETTTELPGAFFYVSSPSLADFAIYYGALFAVLSGYALAPQRRTWALAVAVGIAGFYVWRWQTARDTVTLNVLPLNGGSSVYVRANRSADDLLIDCGNTNSVEFVMKPFLRAQGVNRLPRLALTHGDLRRFGGVEPLRALVPVAEINTSSARFRSPAYRRLMAALDRTPDCRRVVQEGDPLADWRVLHPRSNDHFPHGDDNALVLRGEFFGTRVLLLSDLGRSGQGALLEREKDLRADMVVSGLPEQGEPLCDALLDAIQPRLIVVTDSEFPAHKRAGLALRERLERRGVPVIYTRNAGAVKVEFGPGTWKVRICDGSNRVDRILRPQQVADANRETR
jgi:ComEC/Rec2-related protein